MSSAFFACREMALLAFVWLFPFLSVVMGIHRRGWATSHFSMADGKFFFKVAKAEHVPQAPQGTTAACSRQSEFLRPTSRGCFWYSSSLRMGSQFSTSVVLVLRMLAQDRRDRAFGRVILTSQPSKQLLENKQHGREGGSKADQELKKSTMPMETCRAWLATLANLTGLPQAMSDHYAGMPLRIPGVDWGAGSETTACVFCAPSRLQCSSSQLFLARCPLRGRGK